MKTLALAVAALAAGTLWGEGPAVWWASAPVKPGEHVLVSGGNWGTKPVVSVGGKSVRPDRVSDSGLIFCLPSDASARPTFSVVDESGRKSVPYRLNEPQAWWMQGDDFDRSTPGSVLRVFGRCLKVAEAELVAANGTAWKLKVVRPDDWSLDLMIPASVPHGTHVLRLDGTDVGRWEVAPLRVWRSEKVFDVTAYGAVPDDRECDQAGVEAALSAAKANGGGVIFFPRGRYNLNDTVSVPSNTVLRGVSRDASALCWPDYFNPPRSLVDLDSGAGAEDLMLSSGLYGTGITTPKAPGYFGKPVSDLTLKRLVLRFVTNIHRDDRKGNDFLRRFNTPGSPLSLRNVTRLAIEDCDVVMDKNGVDSGCSIGGRHVRVLRTSFRGTGWVPLAAKHAVFEDNEFAGICISVLPGTRELFWCRNRHSDRFSGDREAITHDLRNCAYVCDPLPASVRGAVVTMQVPKDVKYVFPGWIPAPWGKMEQWVGKQIFVVSGRGRGQIRDIVRVISRDVYEVDRPFDIAPDETSRLVVGEERCHLTYVDNTLRDANHAVALYGGAHETVVARNDAVRAGGFTVCCVSGPKAVTTVWDNQFVGNRLVGGMRPVASGMTADSVGSTVRCGEKYFDVHSTLIRGNEIDHSFVGLGGFDELAEGNVICNAKKGVVEFGNDATHLLTNNVFRNVEREYARYEPTGWDLSGVPWRVAAVDSDVAPTNVADLAFKTVESTRGGGLVLEKLGIDFTGKSVLADCVFEVPENGKVHIALGCRTSGVRVFADEKLVRDEKADVRPTLTFIMGPGRHVLRMFLPRKPGVAPKSLVAIVRLDSCEGFRYVK